MTDTTESDRLALTTDLSKGDRVRVHYRPSPSTASETIEGVVSTVYTAGKFTVSLDGSHAVDADLVMVRGQDRGDESMQAGNHVDGFDDDLGRPMFVDRIVDDADDADDADDEPDIWSTANETDRRLFAHDAAAQARFADEHHTQTAMDGRGARGW